MFVLVLVSNTTIDYHFFRFKIQRFSTHYQFYDYTSHFRLRKCIFYDFYLFIQMSIDITFLPMIPLYVQYFVTFILDLTIKYISFFFIKLNTKSYR